MTATIFLLRHAAHDSVGSFLAGRLPGIHLGEAGRAQAGRLAERMRREQVAAVHSSPRERAQETASSVAAACGLQDLTTSPELDEVDFGPDWSGKDFASLDEDPAWRRWNQMRSFARTNGGETMLDVQLRALRLIERLVPQHTGDGLVLVTHSEVIKAIVSHVLGLPIDAWNRFEVAPGSVSTFVAGEWGAKLLTLNEVVV